MKKMFRKDASAADAAKLEKSGDVAKIVSETMASVLKDHLEGISKTKVDAEKVAKEAADKAAAEKVAKEKADAEKAAAEKSGAANPAIDALTDMVKSLASTVSTLVKEKEDGKKAADEAAMVSALADKVVKAVNEKLGGQTVSKGILDEEATAENIEKALGVIGVSEEVADKNLTPEMKKSRDKEKLAKHIGTLISGVMNKRGVKSQSESDED